MFYYCCYYYLDAVWIGFFILLDVLIEGLMTFDIHNDGWLSYTHTHKEKELFFWLFTKAVANDGLNSCFLYRNPQKVYHIWRFWNMEED